MSERKMHGIGWLLFLICSLFYTADAVINGNMLGIMGGILFFSGCVVFMVPFYYKA